MSSPFMSSPILPRRDSIESQDAFTGAERGSLRGRSVSVGSCDSNPPAWKSIHQDEAEVEVAPQPRPLYTQDRQEKTFKLDSFDKGLIAIVALFVAGFIAIGCLALTGHIHMTSVD